MRVLDVNKFNEKLNKKYGNEFKLLGKYEGTHSKTLFKAYTCSHEFEITPNNLMQHGRCPICSKEKTIKNLRNLYNLRTSEDFINDLKNKRTDWKDYSLISEYTGSQNKIRIEHKCGYEFDVRATTFLNDGAKCPMCFKTHQNEELFNIKFFKKFSKDEYEILIPFTKSSEKIKIKHKCGEIIDIYPSNVLSKSCKEPCASCREKRKQEDFIKKFNEDFRDISDLFELVDMNNVYTRKTGKIKVKHKKCGKILQTTISELFKNKHCKYCSSSIGESKIIYYLTKKNVCFEYKYKGFEDCKNILPLEFDFVLFNSDNSVFAIIEYDGEQHQKPFRFGDPEKMLKKFNETKLRDSIKNEYCKNNNLNLYRIPYTEEKNLETHLIKILENYNFNDYS